MPTAPCSSCAKNPRTSPSSVRAHNEDRTPSQKRAWDHEHAEASGLPRGLSRERPAVHSCSCQAELALGDGLGPATVSIRVLTLALTGAIVGVVPGLALVWLGSPGRL